MKRLGLEVHEYMDPGDGTDSCVAMLGATRCYFYADHPIHKLSGEGDTVDHPPHYNAHPSGVECIEVTEHFGFCIGNAIKYLWRADEKGNALEDLKKARWYVDREIKRREAN